MALHRAGALPVGKQAFLPFLIASPVMFLLGASFAYFIILPWAFDFFLGFQSGPLVLPDDPAAPVVTEPKMAGIVFRARSRNICR